jgi:beta-N-acetylhexosaminidase
MNFKNLSAAAKKKLAQAHFSQCFLVGFRGLDFSPTLQKVMKDNPVAGFLLFAQNFESPAQLLELCTQIQASVQMVENEVFRQNHRHYWIAIDQEGGRVQRLKKGFVRVPSARFLAQKASAKDLFTLSSIVAKQLALVGINVNFAPVADVDTEPHNPIIGDRAYSSDPEIVAKFVSAFLRGHLVSGVMPCVKHFPGHGDTVLDSHVAIPRVLTPRETLLKRECLPFERAFKVKCPMLMTAHVIYEDWDPENLATCSVKIMRDHLRGQMHYSGLVFSDDLEMKAITTLVGKEGPVLALKAGCDVLIYQTEEGFAGGFERVRDAIARDEIEPEIILTAVSRIHKHKAMLPVWQKPTSILDLHHQLSNQQIVDFMNKF